MRQTLPTPPPSPEIYNAELAVRAPPSRVSGCRVYRATRRGRWGLVDGEEGCDVRESRHKTARISANLGGLFALLWRQLLTKHRSWSVVALQLRSNQIGLRTPNSQLQRRTRGQADVSTLTLRRHTCSSQGGEPPSPSRLRAGQTPSTNTGNHSFSTSRGSCVSRFGGRQIRLNLISA